MSGRSAEGSRVEGWLRPLLEGASIALLVVGPDGRVVLASQGAEPLFGYLREELIGCELERLIPRAPGAERFGHRKDGREVAVEVGLNSLETPGGPLTLASIVDLSARRHTEDELRRTTDDLQQFAYVASHDLQEPLRMVASYTQLLAQRYQGQLDERADKYIHYAVDGAKRMQRLLADLLAYSRVSSQGKPLLAVSADAVAKGVVDTLKKEIRQANATVTIGPLPTVLADQTQLGLLLQNLLGNALKFHGEAPPLVQIGASPLDDRWQFAVKDNGIGIDNHQADRTFKMFQRLHERGKYEGNGVGLAIAKRILERHGGRIWLDSQPGAGSTFFFTLRAASATGQP